MIVESYPATLGQAEEYNRWYTGTHLPEVCGIEGFVRATRFAPTAGDGPYVAVYELERENLSSAIDAVGEAVRTGSVQVSGALRLDPSPQVRVLSLIGEYPHLS